VYLMVALPWPLRTPSSMQGFVASSHGPVALAETKFEPPPPPPGPPA
jgi:hypothetical protein